MGVSLKRTFDLLPVDLLLASWASEGSNDLLAEVMWSIGYVISVPQGTTTEHKRLD